MICLVIALTVYYGIESWRELIAPHLNKGQTV